MSPWFRLVRVCSLDAMESGQKCRVFIPLTPDDSSPATHRLPVRLRSTSRPTGRSRSCRTPAETGLYLRAISGLALKSPDGAAPHPLRVLEQTRAAAIWRG